MSLWLKIGLIVLGLAVLVGGTVYLQRSEYAAGYTAGGNDEKVKQADAKAISDANSLAVYADITKDLQVSSLQATHDAQTSASNVVIHTKIIREVVRENPAYGAFVRPADADGVRIDGLQAITAIIHGQTVAGAVDPGANPVPGPQN